MEEEEERHVTEDDDEEEEKPITTRSFKHKGWYENMKQRKNWTLEDIDQFTRGIERYGNNAERIQAEYLPNRTVESIARSLESKKHTHITNSKAAQYNNGPWSREEREALHVAVRDGRYETWEEISTNVLPLRSAVNIQRYYEQHFNRHFSNEVDFINGKLAARKQQKPKARLEHELKRDFYRLHQLGKRYKPEDAQELMNMLHFRALPSVVGAQIVAESNLYEGITAADKVEIHRFAPNRFLPRPASRKYAHCSSGKLACVFDPQRFVPDYTLKHAESVVVFADENQVYASIFNSVKDNAPCISTIHTKCSDTVPQILQLVQLQHPTGQWFVSRHYNEVNLFGINFNEGLVEQRTVQGTLKQDSVLRHVACSPFEPSTVALLYGKSELGLLDLVNGFPAFEEQKANTYPYDFITCEFSSHPRVVDVLSRQGLVHFDLRASKREDVWSKNTLARESDGEELLSFARIPQNRFEYLVVSSAEARTIDIRFPKQVLKLEPHAFPFVNESRLDRQASRIELQLDFNGKQAFVYQTCSYPTFSSIQIGSNNNGLAFSSLEGGSSRFLYDAVHFKLPESTPKFASVLGAGYLNNKWVVLASTYDYTRSHLRATTTTMVEWENKQPMLALTKL